MASTELEKTALHALHLDHGAKMVPFAGYDMPVQYPLGVMGEHRHCREQAGLFDVSHMGQVRLLGDDPATSLEALVPGDIKGLDAGQMRYTMFTNDAGGVLDDLMVLNQGDHLFLVVNAACKAQDLAWMAERLDGVEIEHQDDRALMALQGPAAAAVLAAHAPDAAAMPFMIGQAMTIGGVDCLVTRSGYTGEDGYEIGMANSDAETVAALLLGDERVAPIGLGARDSLRLEAGLCLYGHDLDQTTSPIEAALLWTVAKRRREEGGFPGADRIQREIAEKPSRRRVGIKPEGRVVAREGVEIQIDGETVGTVTSGGFGPSVEHPVGMGYVAREHAVVGAKLDLMVRGQARPAEVVKLPFHPHRYYRG